MYKFTRQEVAEKLHISTRSVDRYIKSGKLRAKKEGKVVYVKGSDVENILHGGSQKQEVIVPKKQTQEKEVISSTLISTGGSLDQVYTDMKKEIHTKDAVIQDLSLQLGRAQEIAKNSVSLIEFKKSQFLLEESRGYLNREVEDLREEKEKLTSELNYEKNSNIILIIFVIVLLVIAGTIWFMQI